VEYVKRLLGVGTKIFLDLEERVHEDEKLEEIITVLRTSLGRVLPLIIVDDDYNWENEKNRPVFEAVNTVCSPVFMKRNDKLRPWFGGTQGESTGVLSMITLNLPRAAVESSGEESYFTRIRELTELSAEGLSEKRSQLEAELKSGKLPATSSMVNSFDGFFSAVGVVGMNEALQILVDRGIGSMQGKAIAYKTMELIWNVLKGCGDDFCLAAEPSDGASYRLARLDREKHPGIKQMGTNAPFYASSTSLPVDYTDDLWDALEHQKKLQTIYGGGSIFNIALRNGIEEADGCKLLTRRIIEKTGVPCFAFSPPVELEGVGRLERLGYWYNPVSGMSAGEKEEVGLRRPFAVVSGW
jgi:anaerobic ribonucleoside-triphosphate reductase